MTDSMTEAKHTPAEAAELAIAEERVRDAAPDMLAALQELIRIRDWAVVAGADKAPLPQDLIVKFAEMQIPAVDAARAAIAKALGDRNG